MAAIEGEGSDVGVDPGDLGRRVREQRERLGLSVVDLAQRAGMAPGYLEYVEGRPSANPGPAVIARLAAALGTTTAALRGAGVSRPPGASRTSEAHPVLEHLERAECLGLLRGGGVGRVVFDEPRGPVAFPVNFALEDGELLIRTTKGSIVDAVQATGRLSFEVDHLDEVLGEGWSVLVIGRASVAPVGAEPVPVEPWVGGERPCLVRIRLEEVSGRRIRHEG
jgi:transcriptional regulator with XRE-family HTH domain